MADVAEFANGDVLKPLAFVVESFVDLYDRFPHDGVGFLTTSAEQEVFSSSHSCAFILVIQANPQQGGTLSAPVN